MIPERKSGEPTKCDSSKVNQQPVEQTSNLIVLH